MRTPKNLADILLMFARARTASERTNALYYASQSNRFDEEQQRILRDLHQEARTASDKSYHTLRPVVLASTEDPNLIALTAGEAPVLDATVRAELAEWIDGWNHESGLLVNQCSLPGPLLLHGPTGCGKTTTCQSLLGQMNGRPGVVLECHRILESHLGVTGQRLTKAFDVCARTNSLMVIEEIDALAMPRGGSSASESENNRITVALMRLFESATFPIVATTNRPESLDVALMRRFDFKLELLPLPEDKRLEILEKEFGASPPQELVALPLNDSLPKIKRLKRARLMEKLKQMENAATQPAAV